MKVLVVSDIHGNLPALETIFKEEKNYDLFISLGDVVNYGPWSNECVDLLESIDNKILLLGNHEEAFINGFYPGKNPIVQAFFETCYADFNRLNTIKKYIKETEFNNFKLIHTINDSYVFGDSDINITENIMLGHSHSQFLKKIGEFYLMNPGSVGQNRKNPNIINYVIWETVQNNFELKSLEYDVNILIQEMERRNFPYICVNYISNKLTKLNE